MFLALTGFLTPASGFDPDALTYFAVSGITDTTEKDAVNQLVLDLKGTGSTTNNTDVWSDLLAVYPISPTSLDASKYNLKDPSSYKITWFNSPTHASTGVTGDGSTSYGDSGFATNLFSAFSYGYTISTSNMGNLRQIGTNAIIGFYQVSGTNMRLYSGPNANYPVFNPNYSGGKKVLTGIKRAANDKEAYVNGVSTATNTVADAGDGRNTKTFYWLARNNGASAGSYTIGEMDFGAFHNALTDNQAQDLYDAITTYNTALSR